MIVLDPLAIQVEAVALVSATCVSRLDTLHVSVLIENQLGVHQPRNLSETGPEHRGVCSP